MWDKSECDDDGEEEEGYGPTKYLIDCSTVFSSSFQVVNILERF